MNDKDTTPGSSVQFNNLPPVGTQFGIHPDSNPELREFIWLYCDPVYFCVARLTGVSDPADVELVTGKIIHDLWNNRITLLKEKRPGIFVFKTLLQQVFIHLKQQGNEERIRLLQRILLINLDGYSYIIEPGKVPLKPITYSYLLSKIKRLWKTF